MLRTERLERTTTDYLGPAEVTAVDLHDLTVRIGPEHEVDARLALAYPYQPVPGDLVLTIGQGDDYYVIGVLRGSGRTELAFEGDVALRAVGGRLDIHADQGVQVCGPEVEIRTGRLRITAESLVEKVNRAYQHVRELLTCRAGRMHTVVDDSSIAKARRTTILSDENATINGKQINLG
jgi:hypothetical protein